MTPRERLRLGLTVELDFSANKSIERLPKKEKRVAIGNALSG